MPALYRTYRPQSFEQVVGQEIVKTTLQNAIMNNRTVHSYLFSGPRGTGKTTMARIFAKALNCLKPKDNSAEPCNTCDNCKAINDNAFIDLIEIDAASNRGIDEIRNLKEAVRFAPSQKNGYKIYIIDESHMLTKDASNALLKTLEEPPKNTIFILATTDPHKMLPTILSRVQKFDFKPLSSAELREKIMYIAKAEKISIDGSVVNQIILQAMGGARDAESILGKLISSGIKDINTEFASSILGKNSYFEAYTLLEFLSNGELYPAIKHIHNLYDEGFGIHQLILNLLNISHSIFLTQISPNLLDMSILLESEHDMLTALSKNIPQSKIIIFIQELERIKSQTYSAYIPYLPLELIIAQIWAQNIPPSNTEVDTIPRTKEIKKSITKAQVTAPMPEIILEKEKSPNKELRKIESKDTNSIKKSVSADINNVQKLYPEINKSLSKANKSLSVIFAKTQPIELSDKTLTIAVESNFYRDRLEKHSNIILDSIAEFIESIVGINFIAQKITALAHNYEVPHSIDNDEPKDMNDTIADIFKDSL
jgi:DNA polymerase III subunit gamma/tau